MTPVISKVMNAKVLIAPEVSLAAGTVEIFGKSYKLSDIEDAVASDIFTKTTDNPNESVLTVTEFECFVIEATSFLSVSGHCEGDGYDLPREYVEDDTALTIESICVKAWNDDTNECLINPFELNLDRISKYVTE